MKYLILLLLLSVSLPGLDLTIPEQPAAEIPEKEYFFNWGDYNEPPTKSQVITFWILQGLDVYTSHQGLKRCGGCKETNFLLPEQPTLSELLLHKAIFGSLILNHSSKNQMTFLNGAIGYAVINNYEIYN
jgi:hypothetical protein